MTDLVALAQSQIKTILAKSCEKAAIAGELTAVPSFDISVEIPKDLSHGDFSSNAAMQMTKLQKMPPRKIADILISYADLENTYFEKIEAAGPGFLNFTLKKEWFWAVNPAISKGQDNYGRVDIGNGKKVMVEFVSANPTGPMHMGNARGGALGDCLASVLDFAGYAVTREFYVNDAGNQIEKFGNSLEARYLQIYDASIAFPEDGYHGDDITEHAQNYAKQYGDKLLALSSEERKKELVAFALPQNIEKIKSDMERYRIQFDVWFHESSLYQDNEVDETIAFLKQSGLTYEKEGALWLKSTEFGCEKDDVLIRANGFPTYFAADIAYHRNKFVTRGFDQVIDIWGADHHGHIARMKGAMQALGIAPERLTVLTMQLVRLMQGGEIVRMSKRSGKSVTLSDLLDETSIDAARFFFNMRQAASHLDFDLDLAVSQSSENPVYYVQYAHARICSIIRNLEQEGVSVPALDAVDVTLLLQKEEIELMRHLCYLPNEIRVSAETLEPSRLTRYLIDLASYFHSFYNACRVKCEDEALMLARLHLCDNVRIVMKNVLTLIGIDAPEKM